MRYAGDRPELLPRRLRPRGDRRAARTVITESRTTTTSAGHTGFRPCRSFTDITGESTDQFPRGTDRSTRRGSSTSRSCSTSTGQPIALGSDAAQEDAVVGVRRTTLAARLKAIYGDVNKVDAFVGMVSEKHVAGNGVRPAAARDVDEAVRRAPRRRPLLLRERSGARPHPPSLRRRLPGDARAVAGSMPAHPFRRTPSSCRAPVPTVHTRNLHGHAAPSAAGARFP